MGAIISVILQYFFGSDNNSIVAKPPEQGQHSQIKTKGSIKICVNTTIVNVIYYSSIESN